MVYLIWLCSGAWILIAWNQRPTALQSLSLSFFLHHLVKLVFSSSCCFLHVFLIWTWRKTQFSAGTMRMNHFSQQQDTSSHWQNKQDHTIILRNWLLPLTKIIYIFHLLLLFLSSSFFLQLPQHCLVPYLSTTLSKSHLF